ncbi:unnamed protein product, partial [Hapterophycus canaliculatus]
CGSLLQACGCKKAQPNNSPPPPPSRCEAGCVRVAVLGSKSRNVQKTCRGSCREEGGFGWRLGQIMGDEKVSKQEFIEVVYDISQSYLVLVASDTRLGAESRYHGPLVSGRSGCQTKINTLSRSLVSRVYFLRNVNLHCSFA